MVRTSSNCSSPRLRPQSPDNGDAISEGSSERPWLERVSLLIMNGTDGRDSALNSNTSAFENDLLNQQSQKTLSGGYIHGVKALRGIITELLNRKSSF